MLSINTIKHYCNLENDLILNSLKELENDKLVTHKCYLESNGRSASGITKYCSTTLGKNYFKDERTNLIKLFFLKCGEILFDKVILTIVISIITSILTTIVMNSIFYS